MTQNTHSRHSLITTQEGCESQSYTNKYCFNNSHGRRVPHRHHNLEVPPYTPGDLALISDSDNSSKLNSVARFVLACMQF